MTGLRLNDRQLFCGVTKRDYVSKVTSEKKGNEGRTILHGLSGIHSKAQDRVNLDGLAAAKGRAEFPAVYGGEYL